MFIIILKERGIDSDFCLALLMDALSKRKTLKLILMSATISTSHFQDYVARELKLTKTVPLLHIPGFTYPVEEIYKADYEEVVRQYSVIEESQVQDYEDDYGRKPSNTIGGNRKREIDYDLLLKLVFTLIKGPQHLPDNAAISQETKSMLKAADGCILIFLPGVPEINRFLEFFKSYWKPEASSKKINLISLHGNTPAAEQKKVFIPAPKGTIKVVAATNVAEASVTIPDVTVVIDTCRVKEMAYDPEIDAFGLIMKFAAKDSLRQRKGRAGRVQAGRCYRMITKGTFEKLPPQSVPEILRLPLESIVLQVWAMLSKAATNLPVACTQLLNRCPDAPSNNSILRAQQNLISLQAIDNNQLILSPLGWHLSRLPCIPRTGKLLIYGCLLNCVYPAVCTAAAMTCRSPFMTAPDMINKVNSCKDRYSGGGLMSDYNIVVQVMQDFQESSDQRRFCRDNGLQYERMLEIKQTMREFLDDLVDIGLVSSVKEGLDMENVNFNGNAKKLNLLAAVYCSGLYPQVAKIIRPPKRFIEVMGAAVEKDVEAKEMKFYIPKASNDGFNTASEEEEALKAMHRNTTADFDISTNDLQRVFIHPSSANFNNTSFKAANYILFGEKQVVSSFNVESKSNDTKIFLRDTSEVTAYSLLFFGGKLDFYPQDGMIAIDHWIT